MSEHGTRSKYAGGCRCAGCTKAHRDGCRRLKLERRALTEANGGVSPIDNHGTRSNYDNWGCRCEPCTAANIEAAATRRAGLNRSSQG